MSLIERVTRSPSELSSDYEEEKNKHPLYMIEHVDIFVRLKGWSSNLKTKAKMTNMSVRGWKYLLCSWEERSAEACFVNLQDSPMHCVSACSACFIVIIFINTWLYHKKVWFQNAIFTLTPSHPLLDVYGHFQRGKVRGQSSIKFIWHWKRFLRINIFHVKHRKWQNNRTRKQKCWRLLSP